MPPRTKQATTDIEAVPAIYKVPEPTPENPYGIVPGVFVHVLTLTGAKFKAAEVLFSDGRGLTIRTDPNGPTSAEISLIPWNAIAGVGLIGKR